MKKFGKLIILTAFIIGTIGVFYVTSVINAKNLPKFDIQTVSGDEQIKENLILTGIFGTTIFSEDYFRVEDGKTIYSRTKSFINHDKLFYNNKHIIDLQTDYRGFMRGKDNDEAAFYENDEKLVYGNVIYEYLGAGDYTFEIDVLDKKTNKRVSSFTHHIPNRHDYWSIELAHTQLIGDELKIMTFNDMTSSDNTKEAHVYTFDIKEKKLISDEVVGALKLGRQDEGYTEMKVIHKAKSDDTQIALYLAQTQFVYLDGEDVVNEYEETVSYEERTVVEEVIIYDLANKTSEKINLKEQFNNKTVPFYSDGHLLYFGKTLKDQIIIEQFDLQAEKVTETLDLNINQKQFDNDNLLYATIVDGKLYYTPFYDTEYTNEPSVIVVDLNEMELVYEGLIQLRDGTITEDMYLYLYNLETK